MERSQYRMTLDIRDSHGACQPEVKQEDTYRSLCFQLTEGGEPYVPDPNGTVIFVAKREDGQVLFNTCRVESGLVIYDLTAQTTARAGVLECELRLYDTQVALKPDGKGGWYLPGEDVHLLSSATFRLVVHPGVYDGSGAVEASSEVGALTDLVARAGSALEEMRTFRQDVDNGRFDGVSLSHTWEGSRLVVTSAAGTSGAELQGPPGPAGPKGDPGLDLSAFSPKFSLSGVTVACCHLETQPLTVTAADRAEVVCCGKNLYDRDTYGLSSGYVSGNNGNLFDSSNYYRSDYIPVAHLVGKTLNLNWAPVTATYPGMAFYDQNKSFLSGGKGNAIVVPEGAVYTRFSVHADNIGDIQLELGDKATDYEPYREKRATGKTVTFRGCGGICTVYGYAEDKPVTVQVQGKVDPRTMIHRFAEAFGYV